MFEKAPRGTQSGREAPEAIGLFAHVGKGGKEITTVQYYDQSGRCQRVAGGGGTHKPPALRRRNGKEHSQAEGWKKQRSKQLTGECRHRYYGPGHGYAPELLMPSAVYKEQQRRKEEQGVFQIRQPPIGQKSDIDNVAEGKDRHHPGPVMPRKPQHEKHQGP